MAGGPPKGRKMPAGGPAAAQGRRPTGFRQRALGEEFSRQKAKVVLAAKERARTLASARRRSGFMET